MHAYIRCQTAETGNTHIIFDMDASLNKRKKRQAKTAKDGR